MQLISIETKCEYLEVPKNKYAIVGLIYAPWSVETAQRTIDNDLKIEDLMKISESRPRENGLKFPIDLAAIINFPSME